MLERRPGVEQWVEVLVDGRLQLVMIMRWQVQRVSSVVVRHNNTITKDTNNVGHKRTMNSREKVAVVILSPR